MRSTQSPSDLSTSTDAGRVPRGRRWKHEHLEPDTAVVALPVGLVVMAWLPFAP